MRREGGWVHLYRAHHKADTMTTTRYIVKAHRDIDGERGLNDFPTIIVPHRLLWDHVWRQEIVLLPVRAGVAKPKLFLECEGYGQTWRRTRTGAPQDH